MKRKFFGAIFCLLLAALSGCAFVNVPLVQKPSPLEEQVLEGDGTKKILLLEINGTISEQEKSGGLIGKPAPSMVSYIRESLLKAEQDKNLAAIILRINSPGGTITASDIIHHDLTEFKKRKKVPVIACIMSVGASGAYYIASAADEIIAHPTAITGSIGVILVKFNVEGLMAKIGVAEQTIKSGDKKDIMSIFRKATPEEVRLGQEIIDQFYGRFLDVIMARPGNALTRDGLRQLADGRIYTADQALQAKLIDKIRYLDEAIKDLRGKVGEEDARVVTYYRSDNFKGSIYSGAAEKDGLVELLGGSMGAVSGGGYMYLWSP
ncbi:signal peptide peptidase SppA [Geobacter pelophilus]|uniref:Signal peptide peptidase SppA n=1 Tax=Geoanaerobacter pelophilus TaxID=60036 RepID=A0AAW4L943_9BACT|nr:signal peptide peptidase SppA [Geoanaerobacter pelophilus]MBT0663686.1 signal peptide peptidase SppA [Geoanaerobacter pelophilus]